MTLLANPVTEYLIVWLTNSLYVYHWLLAWIQLVDLHTQAEKHRTAGRAYKSVGHQLHWDLDDDSGSRCWFTTAAHVHGARTNHHQNSYDIWPPLTGCSWTVFSIAPRLFQQLYVSPPCCSWRLRSVLRMPISTTRSASSSFFAIVSSNVCRMKLCKCAEVYKES